MIANLRICGDDDTATTRRRVNSFSHPSFTVNFVLFCFKVFEYELYAAQNVCNNVWFCHYVLFEGVACVDVWNGMALAFICYTSAHVAYCYKSIMWKWTHVSELVSASARLPLLFDFGSSTRKWFDVYSVRCPRHHYEFIQMITRFQIRYNCLWFVSWKKYN